MYSHWKSRDPFPSANGTRLTSVLRKPSSLHRRPQTFSPDHSRALDYVRELPPEQHSQKEIKSMSGPHPPNIPTQGVGGAAQPPDDSTDTRTPTPTTFGFSMGHPGQVTPLQQYTYGYPMHMPMMLMHQMNQHPPMNYYVQHPTMQMPPRMQVDAMSDGDENQRSPTLRLGAGNKWS